MKREFLLENQSSINASIGLCVHHQTRSKKLVKFSSDFDIGLNYDKVLNIKKDTAATFPDKQKASGDVFAPLSSSNNKPLIFVTDNTDLSLDTPDGEKQFHGTATALFRQKDAHVKVSVDTNMFIHFFSFLNESL